MSINAQAKLRDALAVACSSAEGECCPGWLLGRSREASISRARAHLVWLLMESGLSSVEVGRLLGRDHTTILHLRRAHEARR